MNKGDDMKTEMKIAFIGAQDMRYYHENELACAANLPMHPQYSFEMLRPYFNLVSNAGNMVHAEAPQKLFLYDLKNSANIRITQLNDFLSKNGKTTLRNYMSQKFDCCIVSMANFIKLKSKLESYSKIFEEIDIPIYVFGAGIQTRLPNRLDILEIHTQRLLQVFNEKAKLFGTRGERTSEWLNSVGLKNSKPIGCPSMYVYPEKILSLPPIFYNKKLKILTAGHFTQANMTRENQRYRIINLLELLCGQNASYVFQDEIFYFEDAFKANLIYDSTMQTIMPNAINDYILGRLTVDPKINRYYFFHEIGTWRYAASQHDVYIGDRIHCGILAMQAGVPAIILFDDARVAEITDFYSIPSIHIKKIRNHTLASLTAKYLNPNKLEEFKKNFLSRYKIFKNTVLESGLNLHSNIYKINIATHSDKTELQIYTNTQYDRYPDIFGYLSLLLSGKGKIMSFGCSYGYEIYTLAQKYFHDSEFHGVDINNDVLCQAYFLNIRHNTTETFFHLGLNSPSLDGHAFDCIFAMSVLCKWPETRDKLNISDIFSFNTFNDILFELDKKLKIGGYIVIYNANYIFEESNIYYKYTPIECQNFDSGFVQKYDCDGNRHKDIINHVIFRKNM